MFARLSRIRGLSILVFFLLYFLFDAGHEVYTGLTVPGGRYIAFLDQHLNYVRWLRSFLLNSADAVLGLFGYYTKVDEYAIRTGSGGVGLVYSCLGLRILSFWWAIILAFPEALKRKLVFFAGGTLIILLLNIVRICAMAMVYSSDWGRTHRHIDHHLIFNIVVYGILFYMLHLWFRRPCHAVQEQARAAQGNGA